MDDASEVMYDALEVRAPPPVQALRSLLDDQPIHAVVSGSHLATQSSRTCMWPQP